MIDLGAIVAAALAVAGIVGGGSAPDPAAEAAEGWLAALIRDDAERLAASTALPFTHRSSGLRAKCDVVAKGPKALRHWAACVRASRELRLTELPAWRDLRLARRLPPAPLSWLKHGLGEDVDGHWVQGFVSDDAELNLVLALLVVEAPGGVARIQAFVIHRSR